MTFYRWQDGDLILHIRVQPKAANDAIAEIMGEQLKIRITAPPVDGKANKHLKTYLSKLFKVAKTDVEILSGDTGRNKQLIIRQPKQLPDIIARSY